MSGKTHKKRSGHRTAKKALGMRTDEARRHTASGLGHSASRGEPHVGHTRRQQGETLKTGERLDRPDRTRKSGRPSKKER